MVRANIPLSLYVHIPWCVQKCPYCDFNSHKLPKAVDFARYIKHLIRDLETDLPLTRQRPLCSVFIGGGTPSLLNDTHIGDLLTEIKKRIPISDGAEITLEANPNSADTTRFQGYAQSGVNRISLGIQSFSSRHLKYLGRVHNSEEGKNAILLAKSLKLASFNVDLMHGLPRQNIKEALTDLTTAIAFNPLHLSWYQLTIEPYTLFASRPPKLPHDDLLWKIYREGHKKLLSAGYQHYETSAYAKPGFQCQHNINYWQFGDYIGIGCGAHGKLSQLSGDIIRTVKTTSPHHYLTGNYLDKKYNIPPQERPFEYFMNRFRLYEPVPKAEFCMRTFLSLGQIESIMTKALLQGYITDDENYWYITSRGKHFLNELLLLFL